MFDYDADVDANLAVDKEEEGEGSRRRGVCNISINCEQLKRAYEYIMLPGVIYAPVSVCALATETWRNFAGQGWRGRARGRDNHCLVQSRA